MTKTEVNRIERVALARLEELSGKGIIESRRLQYDAACALVRWAENWRCNETQNTISLG